MIPLLIIIASGAVFLLMERLFPGRALPNSRGWYARSVLLNAFQFSLVFIAGATWNRWFQGHSIFHFAGFTSPIVEGFFFWFVGTFVFYWWHRLRHEKGWWLVFHQVHHSPARIEALTAFYKHPVEMAVNSMLISAIIFVVFGGSIEAAGWYNVFAVIGEFFYHANLHTPRWFGYFIQRPEQHSVHHATGVHRYNFGDITWWDRLFGTFREADRFVNACGFSDHREEKIGEMLAWKDVNETMNSPVIRLPQPILGMLYAVVVLSVAGGVYFAATHGRAAPAANQTVPLPFAMDVPEGWTETRFEEEGRVEGVRTYVKIDGETIIFVRDVLKEGRSFGEIAAELAWDEADADAIVALMKAEASELFPDFSERDVRVSSTDDTIGGLAAVHSTLQCLKPCYVEDGASTTVRYLVDAPDRVYILQVELGASTNVSARLNAADAVVRTFRIR